ncbi:S-methyl-5'-thioadenosine phosphorylase [Contarinia nasturtii]|uniref:S-methyl-5'-thioadenosine phosphorylase n=1 Tax=Contarinia nasturtii TaxID=265458 RepID=UPI0012D42CD6|nr:S-methyl-5'-thioadenosine phosphorylase [Contarinia nasturtii]
MSDIKIKVGIIGGSGLDDPEILDERREIYRETPYGAPSDVLVEGKINGVECVLLARHGRKHSIMPSNINYRANIWALKNVGCTHIIVSTATGSLQEDIKPGDIVILDNFIDRTTKRNQTFYDGKELSPFGVCHLPMEPAFCEKTRDVIIQTACDLGIPVHERGTVITIEGPRFSSKAESLMFKQWGAQLVNMTTVPEVVLAKEAGLCYGAIAMATDYDCWRSHGTKVCVNDVLAMFKSNVSKVTQLLLQTVVNIAKEDWTETINELSKTTVESVMLPHN